VTAGRLGRLVRPADAAPGGSRLPVYGLLTGLALLLAVVRLLTGPWLELVGPVGVMLLEGWPAQWEVVYFLQLLPNFAGDGPPRDGLAPVHQRALIEMFVTGALYAWTGSVYWSFALVDLAGWALAGIATFHLGLRLGCGRRASLLGAVLVVTSPLFASRMWTHVFHPAEFASLPVGLWAALTLLARCAGEDQASSRRARRTATLAGGLGLVLFGLSLTYQYQWVVLPLAGVAALTWPGGTGGRRVDRVSLVLGVVGAVVVLGLATLALRGLLALGGVPFGGSLAGAVSRPDSIVLERLRTEGVWWILPQLRSVQAMVLAYHPLVVVVALAGLCLLPWRFTLLTAVASALALVTHAHYAAGWSVMSAYPLVYLAAGAGCAGAGVWLARLLRRPDPHLPAAVAVVLLLLLATLTNVDLAGNVAFARQWMGIYAPAAQY
jgi:hypothetical protein